MNTYEYLWNGESRVYNNYLPEMGKTNLIVKINIEEILFPNHNLWENSTSFQIYIIIMVNF